MSGDCSFCVKENQNLVKCPHQLSEVLFENLSPPCRYLLLAKMQLIITKNFSQFCKNEFIL